MKRILAITASLSLVVLLSGAASAQSLKPWSAAKYHGLAIGRSSRADVRRQLGKPDSVGTEEDTGLPIMTYTVSDPLPGKLVVYTENGIVDGMTLYPRKDQTKDDIVRIFGPDFIVVHYAVDQCSGDGGTAPIYETSSGPIKHMEYRDRGLAAIFSQGDDQKVEAIAFTSRAFGPPHSSCKGSSKKK